MSKDVNDYLTEGMYGTRLPKEDERRKYLGTLRERIILALTIGQVMSDKGIAKLEEAMKENKGSTLLINGHVSARFMKEEKSLATKYNIPYTVIANEQTDTDIGAVLTYDYAIDKEEIFLKEDNPKPQEMSDNQPSSFLEKVKQWFK
ncbi:YueI family protein [Oceanobacillus bengalensis]|uniref:DUF1694 domain-containing protein n=1 Tax=Oceanobacillus bengalensis TaxID=1435466 RepID=A0A494Z2S8_9BACI|nr:YueI family protein [Oceanobacillus bengalensis]RKQ16818.1 DUF1694 domain-containing protein [Oceanobacillus bengalensis]